MFISNLNSQPSSWLVLSVWGIVALHPLVTYRHGNMTELATFSIAKFLMFPENFATHQKSKVSNTIKGVISVKRHLYNTL